ncbi:nucleotidyltransferase family protein [Ferrovibrio terrae]|uniref:nucleotidyltransferase family protein n=1 Tax=Ferrovibrio terrae TaxID=2594003 RepID=UPI003137C5E5
MINWHSLVIPPDATIRRALEAIDSGTAQFALVATADYHLLGVVTDGDIRRALLKSIPLDQPVSTIMNRQPKILRQGESRDTALAIMRTHILRHVPVLDASGRIIGLETLSEFVSPEWKDNLIVLMAGGLGSRLRPLTHDKPKPLLEVGGQPILETIVRHFVNLGFRRFCISVNYRAEQIVEHFGDGHRFGAEITYLHETEQLGTAGSLSLLPERPDLPFLVMNGDILTNLDFLNVVNFHVEHNSIATMCVREHEFQVPYGVVESTGGRFTSIAEKPVYRFMVSAGIYVLNPAVLDSIDSGTSLNMPDLFERVRGKTEQVYTYKIQEYWLDIGKAEDFVRANEEFSRVFG